MSTRSEIIIKSHGKEIKLYHHHDGYISGVGFDLLERFGKHFDGKSFDISGTTIANLLVKDVTDEYEITLGNHTDIEFQYTIDVDEKTITAVAGNWWDDYDHPEIYQRFSYDDIKKKYEAENAPAEEENGTNEAI